VIFFDASSWRETELGRTTALLCSLALIWMTSPPAACAQAPRWEIDVNASRIQYDTLASLNAPSLSSMVEWHSPSFLARLNGGITGFEGAGWSTQGRADVAGWLSPSGGLGLLRVEVAGTGAASRHSSGFDSFLTRGDARVHLAGRRVGGWGGVGVAAAKSSFDTESVTGIVPTAGLWAQSGPLRATLSYAHTSVAGERYPETNLVLASSRGPVDVTVYGGFRRSTLESSAYDQEWLGGSAAVWVHSNVALVLSGGRYASDVLQGLPGGDFVSLGIRLTPRRSRPISRMAVAPIVFSSERARSGGIALRVPGAERVEIAGDWNDWQLEPLVRDASGDWLVPPGLGPGVYRFNLRVDGERWIVPDGVPEVEGGYGDRVGLLIISEG
jgi:hypothetical protein